MAASEKRYTIAGRTFRIEPLTFRQEEWLREHIVRDRDIVEMDDDAWKDLLGEKAGLFLAISLIEGDQSRADKVKAGYAAVEELAEFIETNATPFELMGIIPDFFVSNPPANLWALVKWSGRGRNPSASGSPISELKSVSSPTET